MIWQQVFIILLVLAAALGLASRWSALQNRYLRFVARLPPTAAGILAYLLPFLEQPRLESLEWNLAGGGLLFAAGVFLRLYAKIYLWRKNNPLARCREAVLVRTGPYAQLRHPQLLGSMMMLGGWFILFGALYSLFLFPLFMVIFVLQAGIEERFQLQPRFGDDYREYRVNIPAFLPRFLRLRPPPFR